MFKAWSSCKMLGKMFLFLYDFGRCWWRWCVTWSMLFLHDVLVCGFQPYLCVGFVLLLYAIDKCFTPIAVYVYVPYVWARAFIREFNTQNRFVCTPVKENLILFRRRTMEKVFSVRCVCFVVFWTFCVFLSVLFLFNTNEHKQTHTFISVHISSEASPSVCIYVCVFSTLYLKL